MTREIDFRIWDSHQKKYLTGLREQVEILEMVGFNDSNGRMVWEQFTGQLDMNGQRIFEGDVVRYHYFKKWDGQTYVPIDEWKQGDVQFIGIGWTLNESDEYKPHILNVCIDGWEVIGDIHE